MTPVSSIEIDSCVNGCSAKPTHFYWIGDRVSGILVASCDDHTNRVGLCSWYADITEMSWEEAVVLSVLKA